MRVAELTMEDLKKDNSRMCLSTLRATDRCIACKSYDSCESKRTNKVLHKKRARLLQGIGEAKKKVKNYEKELAELFASKEDWIDDRINGVAK